VDVQTDVTITGTGFVVGSRVLFDGIETGTAYINSTTLLVRMAPRDVGSVEVAVVNPGGSPVKAPQPFAYIDGPLVVFTDPSSGFSTSEVRDVHGQIVQFDQRGRLIWKADGTRLPGFPRDYGMLVVVPPGHLCQCWFEVRFGMDEGQHRAYLTADYGHDNPGTLVDVEVAGGQLFVSRSQVYPPGTFTLSGVVTEQKQEGIVHVSGASVYVSQTYSWREALTDANGAYEIRGLLPGNHFVYTTKTGYAESRQEVAITGHATHNIVIR
jgi:hypothetical protein